MLKPLRLQRKYMIVHSARSYRRGGGVVFKKNIGIVRLHIEAYGHLECLAAQVVANPRKRDVLSYNIAATPWLQSEISLQHISNTNYVCSTSFPYYHRLLLYHNECVLSQVMHVIIIDVTKVGSGVWGVSVFPC